MNRRTRSKAGTRTRSPLNGARRTTASPDDAQQEPGTQGTLASGYSSQSSSGGTAGGVLDPRGPGAAPRDDSRRNASPNESGALAREGVAAGAAGFGSDTAFGRLKPGASGDEEEEMGTDGGAAVTGVSGVSGGGRGTTRSNNTRR